MRPLLFLIGFLFALCAYAQEVKQPTPKTDRITKTKSDKLFHKADSGVNKLDSISSAVSNKLKQPKLSQLKSSKIDSLNPINKMNAQVTGVNRKMTKVDSIFIFNPAMRKVDSMKLAFRSDYSKIKSKTNRKQKKIKHSLDSLQRNYEKRANAITKKFSQKNNDLLAGHENEFAKATNLNTPTVSSQFPSVNIDSSLPATGTNIPGVKANTLGGLQPKTNLLNAIPGLDLSEVKQAQNDVKEVKAVEKQAGAYKKQIQQVKKDSVANTKKLEKMIDDQAQGRKEIKAIKDKQLQLENEKKLKQQYLDKIAQYKNPKKMEAELEQNMANVANSDLLKHEKIVQDAQGDMTKVKKKYGEFQSMKNLPKRPLNPMSQLSLRERIYPGVFFQAWNSKFFSLDIAPQVFYKITTRFDVGTGFVYRVNYDFNKSTWVGNHDLYGFKLFSNFKIYKTFYFRLEAEHIYWQQPVATNSDITESRWTNTLLGGIGKEFMISKRIQGNTVILYNALDKNGSPYPSKVLFRIGFNFSLKKDQRKQFIRSLGSE